MRIAIITLSLSCSACVSSMDYPNDWPQLELTADDCPSIAGTYADVGRFASGQQGNFDGEHLYRYFFEAERLEVSHTRISKIDESSLLIESYESQGRPLTRRLSLGEHYTCGDGRLWLTDRLRIRDDGLALRGSDRIGFVRTETGDLAGESRTRATGRAAYVIPVFARDQDHILWERQSSTLNELND